MELTQLAQQGLAGICIALIGLIALLLNQLFKFMGNNTDAWNKNTEALTRLSDKIEEDIKAQKETAETLRSFRQ